MLAAPRAGRRPGGGRALARAERAACPRACETETGVWRERLRETCVSVLREPCE